MEGSIQCKIGPTQGEFEMNIKTNIPDRGVWGLARLEQGPDWG